MIRIRTYLNRSRVLLALAVVALLLSDAALRGAAAHAQETAPAAPDSVPHPAQIYINWDRFDRLTEIARAIPETDRLTDAARALRVGVPAEAGRLTPIDWYCLGTAWCGTHCSTGKGRPLLRDVSALEGEELYGLYRKGYRIDSEIACRIHARLLTLLGVPSEVMTGLVRCRSIGRGSWVLAQIGETWLRVDLASCRPANAAPWRPRADAFQASTDLNGVLEFLQTHLPDGDMTARQQGLKKPVSYADWTAWQRTSVALHEAASRSEADVLFASKTGLLSANPAADLDRQPDIIVPATPEALTALERLRRKPYRATRGEYLAATVRKYVGLPYVWGGENPNSGFDCSGLVRYVCRTWGIPLPRTAAEQYHVGRAIGFDDLEPGDLVFLANTYKPGVSHVGMYIGDGQWVQAAGTGTGVIIGDVPYFDAQSGPGARRLNLAHLPRVAGEPVPERRVARNAVIASRHAIGSRPSSRPSASGGSASAQIVVVRICGDTGEIANSGCDTYRTIRVPKAQAKAMRRCHRHHPRPGERW